MSKTNHKEEIDLLDLLQIIKNGFRSIGNSFLRMINFFLSYGIILTVIIIIGLILGYFWNKNTVNYLQTDTIVSTDFEGAAYLYKKVEELNFKLAVADEEILKEFQQEGLSKINIKVKPVYFFREISNEEEAYMEYLEETKSLEDDEREEFLKNSVKTHKLTLQHPSDYDSKTLLQKVLKYLRNNEYFNELYKDQTAYITSQISHNKDFIKSLNLLIENYSQNKPDGSNSIVVNGANFDFNGLISRRSELQKETSDLIQQRIKNQEFLKVLDEGSPKKLDEKPFMSKNKMILTPIFLILLFFVILFIKGILVKARNLERK